MSNGLHKKEQIQRLYQKFLDQSITQEEFEKLLDLVKNMDDKEERSRLTYQIWKNKRARQHNRKTTLPKRKKKVFTPATGGPVPEAKAYKYSENRENYLVYKVIAFMVVIAAAFLIYHMQNPGWLGDERVVYLEKATTAGQKLTVLLSDGSKVQLNSGSKLLYPEKFAKDVRQLTLEGEAFFEVVRRDQSPFKVRSGKLITTVLGTSFNIKAFPENQKIEVAVATGEVQVADADEKKLAPQLVRSNTLASYNPAANKIEVQPFDVQSLIAWKEGVVKFDETRFEEVASTLQRWYGVKIMIENKRIGNCVLYGEFENTSLQSVLRMLKVAIDIEYEFTAEGVSISGNGCAP